MLCYSIIFFVCPPVRNASGLIRFSVLLLKINGWIHFEDYIYPMCIKYIIYFVGQSVNHAGKIWNMIYSNIIILWLLYQILLATPLESRVGQRGRCNSLKPSQDIYKPSLSNFWDLLIWEKTKDMLNKDNLLINID